MANKGLMGKNGVRESGGRVVERFFLNCGEPVEFAWRFASSTQPNVHPFMTRRRVFNLQLKGCTIFLGLR